MATKNDSPADSPQAAAAPAPTRRALLSAAGLSVLGAGATAIAGNESFTGPASPAIARKRLSLRMVTTWPKNFPGTGTGVERFAERVSAMTDGAITIKVYAAGELVPALAVFDAVAEGKADLYHGAEYYWQGKHPGFNFFTAVPFGMTATEMNAWLYFGGGQNLWDELAKPFNIKGFPCGNTGVQMGGWYKREIRSLEDFRGLRIRMPGLGGEVCQRLGATPVTKAGGEIFLALSQGNIDATEWIGPWNDLAFGFYEVAPYYYGPGFHEPGATLSLGINLDLWNDLSPAYKAIIADAAAAENDRMLADYNHNNALSLLALREKHGIEMRPFPPDVIDAAARAAEDVLAEVGRYDDIAGRIYGSFFQARKRGQFWTARSDQGYANDRARVIASD